MKRDVETRDQTLRQQVRELRTILQNVIQLQRQMMGTSGMQPSGYLMPAPLNSGAGIGGLGGFGFPAGAIGGDGLIPSGFPAMGGSHTDPSGTNSSAASGAMQVPAGAAGQVPAMNPGQVPPTS